MASEMGGSLIAMRPKSDFCARLAKGVERVHPPVRHQPVTSSGVTQLDKTDDIIPLRPWEANAPAGQAHSSQPSHQKAPDRVAFDRKELTTILGFYGTKVAEGEWRDYAMDFGRDKATFSVFRRSSEVPLYRIVKDPSLARKQGMYSVVAQTGLILKRGQDLATVLRVLAKTPKLSTI